MAQPLTQLKPLFEKMAQDDYFKNVIAPEFISAYFEKGDKEAEELLRNASKAYESWIKDYARKVIAYGEKTFKQKVESLPNVANYVTSLYIKSNHTIRDLEKNLPTFTAFLRFRPELKKALGENFIKLDNIAKLSFADLANYLKPFLAENVPFFENWKKVVEIIKSNPQKYEVIYKKGPNDLLDVDFFVVAINDKVTTHEDIFHLATATNNKSGTNICISQKDTHWRSYTSNNRAFFVAFHPRIMYYRNISYHISGAQTTASGIVAYFMFIKPSGEIGEIKDYFNRPPALIPPDSRMLLEIDLAICRYLKSEEKNDSIKNTLDKRIKFLENTLRKLTKTNISLDQNFYKYLHTFSSIRPFLEKLNKTRDDYASITAGIVLVYLLHKYFDQIWNMVKDPSFIKTQVDFSLKIEEIRDILQEMAQIIDKKITFTDIKPFVTHRENANGYTTEIIVNAMDLEGKSQPVVFKTNPSLYTYFYEKAIPSLFKAPLDSPVKLFPITLTKDYLFQMLKSKEDTSFVENISSLIHTLISSKSAIVYMIKKSSSISETEKIDMLVTFVSMFTGATHKSVAPELKESVKEMIENYQNADEKSLDFILYYSDPNTILSRETMRHALPSIRDVEDFKKIFEKFFSLIEFFKNTKIDRLFSGDNGSISIPSISPDLLQIIFDINKSIIFDNVASLFKNDTELGKFIVALIDKSHREDTNLQNILKSLLDSTYFTVIEKYIDEMDLEVNRYDDLSIDVESMSQEIEDIMDDSIDLDLDFD